MKICSCHLIAFGKFNNYKLEFSDHFNIIEGLNESGKTTLLKFIEGMFYGFAKPYMKRTVYTDDYEKYRPLHSKEYRGSMVLHSQGKEYILQRDFNQQSFQIIDYLTGEELTKKLLKNKSRQVDAPGEYFLQVPSDIFKNTMLMKQNDFKVALGEVSSLTDFLIYSMQSSADNLVDVNDALNDLLDFKNIIGQRRSKTRPYGIVLSKIDQLEERAKALEYVPRSYQDLLSQHQSLKEDVDQLKEDLKKIQDKKNYQAYVDLQEKYREKILLEEDLVALDQKIEKFYFLEEYLKKKQINKADLENKIRQIKEDYGSLSSKKEDLYRSLKHIQDEIEREKDALVILTRLGDNQMARQRTKTLGVLFLAFSLLIFLLAFLGSFSNLSLVVILPLFLSGLLAGFLSVFFFWKRKKAREKSEQLQESLPRTYSLLAADNREINVSIFEQEIEDLLRYKRDMEGEIELIDNRFEKLLSKEEQLNQTFFQEAPEVFQQELGTDQSIADTLYQYQLLELEFRSKQNLLKQYEGYDFSLLDNDLEGNDLSWDRINVHAQEEIERSLDLKSEELLRLEEQIGFKEVSLKEYLVVKEELEEAYKEKSRLEDLQTSIDLAISEINLARQNIQKDFLPEFNSRLTEAVQFITAKRERVVMDKSFELKKFDSEDTLFLDQHLSSGTKDLLYIFLRICLVEAMDELPNLFLFDDAFIQIDQPRLTRAMILLNEISKNSQILLFSCHDREREILEKEGFSYHYIAI